MSGESRTFTKPALSVSDQLALLEGRGLTIPDRAAAQMSLRHIGYYRLSAYMRPFQSTDRTHKFHAGTTFDQIATLYSFDRKLRVIFLDAIDRIEVAIRSALTESLGIKHGSHWFLDPKHFAASTNHVELLQKLKDEIGHSDPRKRAVHIAHYYESYDVPDMPPSWMIVEAISFGSLANLVRNLNLANSKSVAWLIGLQEPALKSWCLSLSYLRNLCAHHSRIWNRVYTLKPTTIRQYDDELNPNDRTYAQAVSLKIMLNKCSGPSNWTQRLKDLIDEFPDTPIDKMGFPQDWKTRTIWKS